jgi:hypothetical protein
MFTVESKLKKRCAYDTVSTFKPNKETKRTMLREQWEATIGPDCRTVELSFYRWRAVRDYIV